MPLQRAVGGEFEHGRRTAAALTALRIELKTLLVGVQRRGATVDDPNVVALVERHTNRRPEQPVVRQRFGPERIDLEVRRLDRLTRLAARQRVDARKHRDKDDDPASDDAHSAPSRRIIRPSELRRRSVSARISLLGSERPIVIT
jgi:hypothetical protein